MANPLSPFLPPPRDGDAGAHWLTPQPWRLHEDPPGPHTLLNHLRNGSDPAVPLLLLIDRRQPLPPACRAQLAASLSSDEQQRHQAYRLADDRERFLLGRSGLRSLLGHWLGLPPQAVPLALGSHGKPHCPGGPAFNVSHAGDLILLALHPLRPVGVDVERLRPDLDWPAIARRMLPPAQCDALDSLPLAERPEGFLAAWCRLEARLKARGTGLAGLEQLRRQEQPAAPPALRPGDRESDRNPLPDIGRSRGGDTTAGSESDHGPRPQAASPACERIWDVQVPSGYRAAVALAPGSEAA